jgi:hypothetical protein
MECVKHLTQRLSESLIHISRLIRSFGESINKMTDYKLEG